MSFFDSLKYVCSYACNVPPRDPQKETKYKCFKI